MTTHRSSWAASVAALLLALVGSSLGAQAPPTPSGEGPWVVRAWYEDRAQLVALAAVTEPWEVHPEEGWLLVDVDREGLALLARLGMRVEVDEKLTAQLTAPRPGRAEQATGIPGYPCYRTVDETYADAAAIAAARPDLVTWTDIGDSWEKVAPGGLPGDDLLVLRLTSPVPGPKPKLFAMGAIHAREYTTAELLLRFAEGLVAGYGLDAEAK